jgi:cell division transport system permease protein
MNSTSKSNKKKRLQTSAFSTIISISLVLFITGLLGYIILNTSKLSNYVKENIGFSIILKDDVNEVDILQLKKNLDASRFTKSVVYVTKEEAAKLMLEDLGEDFVTFLGYNPLLASIEIKLNAQYANNDSISKLKTNLEKNPNIKEIFYQKNLVDVINENVRKISIFLVAVAAVLLLIAIALINNTIKLSIYSKRFLIKSMQLVGATAGFIRKPFVLNGIFQGFLASIIASLMLSMSILYSQKQIPELFAFNDIENILIIYIGILVIGVFISWISTTFAVKKYLKLKTGDLY